MLISRLFIISLAFLSLEDNSFASYVFSLIMVSFSSSVFDNYVMCCYKSLLFFLAFFSSSGSTLASETK